MSKLPNYITKVNQSYKYQRRVPKQLEEYVSTKFIKKSLGKEFQEAQLKALELNSTLDDCIKLIELSAPNEVIQDKLLDGGLIRTPTKTNKQEKPTIGVIVSSYLVSIEQEGISYEEYRDRKYFFTSILIPILGNDTLLSDVTYQELIEFRELLTKLPKGNIQKYKNKPIERLLDTLDVVLPTERLSTTTVNKYIKWIRTLYSYALVRGLVSIDISKAIKLIKSSTNTREERLPLTTEDITLIRNRLDGSPLKLLLFDVLRYSGMRLSELYKLKIEQIEGVFVFDLTDKSIKLKTKSSYRIIPIHSKILAKVLLHYDTAITSITPDNLSKSVNKILRNQDKKSLYSLRHTFTTELIHKGADSNIVSELLGHSLSSQGGMTLSRYSKGYTVKQLQEVIELLP